MSDVEQIRDRASRLYALALKTRDNNLDDYAAQLEELACARRWAKQSPVKYFQGVEREG